MVLALQRMPSSPMAAEHSLTSLLDAPALTEHGKPCPAADAIFPKQLAKTALPPVSPVPGRSKRRQGYKHRLLTAAPACTLEIPKAKSEEEVWNAIRHVTLLQSSHHCTMLALCHVQTEHSATDKLVMRHQHGVLIPCSPHPAYVRSEDDADLTSLPLKHSMCAHTLTYASPSLEQALHARTAPASLPPFPGATTLTCLSSPAEQRSPACRQDAAENEKAEPMLSSFINAAICSQPSLPAAVAFTLAHRLADVNEEDELTTMFCMFTDALAGVRNSTLADLLAVRTRVAP